MKDKFEHITHCFQENLGADNIIAIWQSMPLSKASGIDIFYAGLTSGYVSDGNIISPSLKMSVEMTSSQNKITEMYYVDTEYHMQLSQEDLILCSTINKGDLIASSKSTCSSRPPRDDKGYYAVKSLASSILAERHGWYEECFNRLRPRAENKNDTLFGTCQMLFYMHDNLPPEIVLDWFKHDTPLMRQLRHSSPFAYAAAHTPRKEYDELVFDIVNNPEKYPPLPSHQIWLESILAKGGDHINDFTKRFIPQDRLPQN